MKEAWGEEDSEEVKAVALCTLQRIPLNDSLLIKLDVLKLHCSLVYQRVRTKTFVTQDFREQCKSKP